VPIQLIFQPVSQDHCAVCLRIRGRKNQRERASFGEQQQLPPALGIGGQLSPIGNAELRKADFFTMEGFV
jgi:hypothetical protein